MGLCLTVINGEHDSSDVQLQHEAKQALISTYAHNTEIEQWTEGVDSQLLLGMGVSVASVLCASVVYTLAEWVQMQDPRPSCYAFTWMVSCCMEVQKSVELSEMPWVFVKCLSFAVWNSGGWLARPVYSYICCTKLAHCDDYQDGASATT